jgi:L-alanine-DL-glutamate epimerase-like enolase superfamily enzyme
MDLYPDQLVATGGVGEAPTHLRASYVEIETDEGVSGLYGPIDDRQDFLVAMDLRPPLVGADPLATELIHDKLLRLHRHGRAGLFVNAISAVDNALWDLRGMVAGQPVYQLLSGPTRQRVPVYASMLGHSVEPERAAVVAAEHRNLGFRAQKWFFAHGPAGGYEGLQRNLAVA